MRRNDTAINEQREKLAGATSRTARARPCDSRLSSSRCAVRASCGSARRRRSAASTQLPISRRCRRATRRSPDPQRGMDELDGTATGRVRSGRARCACLRNSEHDDDDREHDLDERLRHSPMALRTRRAIGQTGTISLPAGRPADFRMRLLDVVDHVDGVLSWRIRRSERLRGAVRSPTAL